MNRDFDGIFGNGKVDQKYTGDWKHLSTTHYQPAHSRLIVSVNLKVQALGNGNAAMKHPSDRKRVKLVIISILKGSEKFRRTSGR